MEEVLETYEKAYDPDRPVVCMDEQPVQLIGETRADSCDEGASRAARLRIRTEGDGQYFYVRRTALRLPTSNGSATPHPRMIGLYEVAHLLDSRYATASSRITLVCDNLNTHTKGAFYEAFAPDKARDYACGGSTSRVHSQARELAERGRVRGN